MNMCMHVNIRIWKRNSQVDAHTYACTHVRQMHTISQSLRRGYYLLILYHVYFSLECLAMSVGLYLYLLNLTWICQYSTWHEYVICHVYVWNTHTHTIHWHTKCDETSAFSRCHILTLKGSIKLRVPHMFINTATRARMVVDWKNSHKSDACCIRTHEWWGWEEERRRGHTRSTWHASSALNS